MDYSSLILMEKDKETGFVVKEIGSYNVSEGAFAVIKQDYGFRRFLMRGNKKVIIELLIMAFAYNVNKLHNKTLQGRNGELLHEPKGA